MELAKEKYNYFLKVLAHVDQIALTEVEQIEYCFQTSFSLWQEAEACIQLRTLSPIQRIEFIKTVRSPFIAQIEYYLLRYHALLFEPPDRENKRAFWERELQRGEKFCKEHPEMNSYYKSGSAHRDGLVFAVCSDPYFPGAIANSPDILWGKLMALERYLLYVQDQLRLC
jgi:hypothetical protein